MKNVTNLIRSNSRNTFNLDGHQIVQVRIDELILIRSLVSGISRFESDANRTNNYGIIDPIGQAVGTGGREV